MRNRDSGYKCWVLTFSPFSDINQRMEGDVRKCAQLPSDLAKIQIMRDAEAVELALKWFEEHMRRLRQGVARVFLNIIHSRLLSQCWQSSWTKVEVVDQAELMPCQRYKPCHHTGRFPWLTRRRFTPLTEVVQSTDDFSQQDMIAETSLHYELIPLPLSLFSNRDQKMNKAVFQKTNWRR